MSKIIDLPDGSVMDEKNCLYEFNGEYVNGKAVIPDGVEDIADYVFDCDSAEVFSSYDNGLYLGSKENPYKYFYKISLDTRIAQKLSSLHPDTEYICSQAFYEYCFSGPLVLPAKVKTIGKRAFWNCFAEKIVIPYGCKKIGSEAFISRHFQKPDIIIPDSVSEIEKGAFKGVPVGSIKASPAVFALIGKIFLLDAFEKYLSRGRTEEEDLIWLPEIAKAKTSFVTNTFNSPNSRDFLIALENKWIKTADYDKVMDFAVASGDVELKAALLDYSLKPTEKQIEKKETAEFEKAIGARKLSVSDIKKLWKYRTDDDGKITLTKYVGNETVPYVPNVIGKTTVTRIATEAFSCCRSIEEVYIPEGIVAIGKSAFSFCSKLKSVVLPESLIVVGDDSFLDCVSLEQKPDISKVSLKNCDTNAEIEYDYCNLDVLKNEWDYCIYSRSNECAIKKYKGNGYEIKVPERIFGVPVTEIGMDCFSTGLTSTSCGSGAQQKHNKSIVSITLPDTVKKILSRAFSGCKSLKSINIPQECDIGSGVFLGCEKLASKDKLIIFNDIVYQCTDKSSCYSVYHINQERFDVVIPQGVKKIADGAFSNCKYVDSVTVPDSVTDIEKYSFSNCSDQLMIKCRAGSYAETFAKENGLKYEIN